MRMHTYADGLRAAAVYAQDYIPEGIEP